MSNLVKRIIPPVPERPTTTNLPSAKKVHSITVTIYTPRIDHAGTDANVYFVVNADKFLMNGPADEFERGNTDSYSFELNMTLDELRKARIEIGHDNAGRCAGWF